jgi:hypothetical protein
MLIPGETETIEASLWLVPPVLQLLAAVVMVGLLPGRLSAIPLLWVISTHPTIPAKVVCSMGISLRSLFAGVWHTDGIYDVAATNNHGSGATPNPLTINYAPGSVLVETGTSAINDGAVDVSTTTGFQELRSTNFSDTAPVTTALGYRPSGYQQSFGSVDPNAFNGWSNGAGTAYGLALQVYPYGHFGSTYPWGV